MAFETWLENPVWAGMDEEMDRTFNMFLGQERYPLMNAWVSDHDVVVQAELPGLSEKEVEITVANNTLEISGERKPDSVETQDVYHRRERAFGRFSRLLRLPYKIDAAKVEAEFRNGILSVKMPRAEEDKPRKIEVKCA